jgi:hypothetical protein
MRQPARQGLLLHAFLGVASTQGQALVDRPRAVLALWAGPPRAVQRMFPQRAVPAASDPVAAFRATTA